MSSCHTTLKDFHNVPRETEVNFLKRTILGKGGYIRNGVRLDKSSVVLDAGGNIGAFGLSCILDHQCQRVISFEPSPPVYHALKENADKFSTNTHQWDVFRAGLGASRNVSTFSHFIHCTLWSGFDPNNEEKSIEYQMEMARSVLERESPQKMKEAEIKLRNLFKKLHQTAPYQCDIFPLSEVIEYLKLTKISLLKIDVEKAELDVLLGLTNESWEIIDQVVMEIHDEDGKLDKIIELLRKNKFQTIVVERTPSPWFMLYAAGICESPPQIPKEKDRSVMVDLWATKK